MSDPRVYFAAERTLLAWVRTGLTIIALGFVVARFGLFLATVAATAPAGATVQPHPASTVIGIGLVLMGAGGVAGALYNHTVLVRSLPPLDVPQLPLPRLTSIVAIGVVLSGILLAAYLAVT